jgi:hypothetical protein
MIEVEMLKNERRVNSIEAETPEGALLGARTIYDETMAETQQAQGDKYAFLFCVNGEVIRRVEGRP